MSGWPSPSASKRASPVNDLGERVGRVSRRSKLRRAQRASNSPTALSQPPMAGPWAARQASIDHGELRRPEPDGGKRHEELVFLRVPQVQEPGQAANLGRCGMALGFERTGEAFGARPIRTARAPGDRAGRPGEQGHAPRSSMAASTRRTRRASARAKAPSRASTPIRGSDPVSKNAQPTTAAEPSKANRKPRDSQADAREDARGLAPLRQGHGIDARANVGAEQLEILSEVEPGAQLVDRRVPFVDGLGSSGRQEPCRKCLFASARSRRAKTLEERALAKEIEIGRVRVIDIEISQAVHACTGPAVIQPRQPLGIELHGAGGSTAAPAKWFVNQHQNDEDRERQGQPVGARPVCPVDEERRA